MDGIVSLVLVLLAIVLVMYLSYVFTKYVSRRSVYVNAAEYMKVVDRLTVGQDRFILIVNIGGKHYLISVTAQEIRILKELDDFIELPGTPLETKTFGESFKTVLGNMMSKKK